MPELSRQRREERLDVQAVAVPAEHGGDSEAVPRVVQPRATCPRSRWWRKPGLIHEPCKAPLQGGLGEPGSLTREEEGRTRRVRK